MRRVTGGFLWLAVLVAAGVILSVPMNARAAALAPTPYMGWNTYYGVGGVFDETTIKSVANELISSGLADAGYRIVWLDFGWASGQRDASGQLVVDPTQWPDGMAGLTSWLHARGLEAGIYTDAGSSGCHGKGVGSYGHYQQDADQFAAWGFDAVKVDFCGAGQEIAAGTLNATPQQLYTQFASALANNSSGRPMILNVCNFWTPGQIDGTNPSPANSSWASYQWAPQIAQSWRTDTDIGFGGGRGIAFKDVLRNMDRDANHPEAAGPGHWNDPDYLGPGLGMTDNEAQAQFSMWAMLAAPLILGSDPRKLSQAQITMLKNPDVIALDQDPLGAQATLISQSGSGQVWAKPLADGDVAVALLNRDPTSSLQISTTATAVGLPQATSYSLHDLWLGSTTTTTGEISASVQPQSVTLYRVSPVSPDNSTAMLRIGMAGADSGTVSADGGTLSADSSPLSCPGTCSARYQTQSPVTLTPTPEAGAAFVGWDGGGCSGTAPCTVTVRSDTSVTATFAFPMPRLSVSTSGSGSVTDASGLMSCPGNCSGRYWSATNIALTATPAAGWAFAGWSGGGCSGTGACTVSLSGDTGVTARFVPLHTLTVSVIGGGAGTVTAPGISCPGTCTASYPEGTALTLNATPASGSQFGMWQGGGCPAFASGCTLSLNGDTAVTVAFDRATSGAAYVVTAGKNTVTPINLSNGSTGPAITGFHAPRAIAVSPDGDIAYVVNTGNGSVTPIDLAINAREPAITGLRAPGAIAISPDGRTGYVLENGRRLVPIDLATDQAEPAIQFGQRSGVGPRAAGLAIAPDGKIAYVGTYGSGGTVAAVRLSTGRVSFVMRGFADPAAIALAPGGRTAYVADPVRGRVTAINLAWRRRIFADAFPGAHSLAVTPDGGTVYVAGRGASGIGVIETATSTAQPSAVAGIAGSTGVAIGPGGRAYVTANDGVIPIDLATHAARQIITGFGSAVAIAVAANPPPANASVRLSSAVRRTRSGLSDSSRCLAANTPCTVTQTLTAIRQGVAGRQTLTIAPNHTVRVLIRLNAAARALLERLGRLAVVLSVAIHRGGHADTVTTRNLTIKPAR